MCITAAWWHLKETCNCVWPRRVLYSETHWYERKIHILPSFLLLFRSWIHVHVELRLKKIQGAWTHFEHLTLAFMEDRTFSTISDITSYCWRTTALDQNTVVRNAILVSDHNNVSKTQVISSVMSLHFLLTPLLNKFNDFLLKGYVILCLVCEKILLANKQGQKSSRHCQLLHI